MFQTAVKTWLLCPNVHGSVSKNSCQGEAFQKRVFGVSFVGQASDWPTFPSPPVLLACAGQNLILQIVVV